MHINQIEKLSLCSSILVFLISVYGYLIPSFSASFGLGNTFFIAAAAAAAVSAVAIFKNQRSKSRFLTELVIVLSTVLLFSAVNLRSYNPGDTVSAVLLVAMLLAIFASSFSSFVGVGYSYKRVAALFVMLFAILVFVQTLYVDPSTDIARHSETVLSDNWFDALNWMRENTEECSVVATYWDPGHFIRAIARRAVVFDGATQGAIRSIPMDDGQDGLVITPYENGIKHIKLYKDGNVTTSRINDIAISLMTENESLAIDILQKYRQPGCDMYYLATSDLIGKSVWWSYFSTWDPTISTGNQLSYQIMYLSRVTPLINQNALAYVYPIGDNQAFLLIGINDTFSPFVQQGNQQPVAVENLIYYSESGEARFVRDQNAPVKGTIFVQSDKQVAVYMPSELEASMFTRLFLFNGAGLERFEYINSWGGEVKLFKVNFPDTGSATNENFSGLQT